MLFSPTEPIPSPSALCAKTFVLLQQALELFQDVVASFYKLLEIVHLARTRLMVVHGLLHFLKDKLEARNLSGNSPELVWSISTLPPDLVGELYADDKVAYTVTEVHFKSSLWL